VVLIAFTGSRMAGSAAVAPPIKQNSKLPLATRRANGAGSDQ